MGSGPGNGTSGFSVPSGLGPRAGVGIGSGAGKGWGGRSGSLGARRTTFSLLSRCSPAVIANIVILAGAPKLAVR